MTKKIFSVMLVAFLVWPSAAMALAQQGSAVELQELVNKPYLELLELSPRLNFRSSELDSYRKQLERQKKADEDKLKQEEKGLEQQIDRLRKQLSELNKRASFDTAEMEQKRQSLHCDVLRLEDRLRRKKTEREHGVPVAYDNKLAKIDLIEQWPGKQREINQAIVSGQARRRRHGDAEDIGIRTVGQGQEKDVKLGEDSIRKMKAYGLMPPEIEDKEVTEYVRRLAIGLAANSDLKVPLQVTLLDSPEINAFALPGGYIFINSGLVQKAETESEVAGVIAHEIAHAAARHGARLMKKATIAGIIFQSAQLAAIIFTGGAGAVGLGTYYALQYGFYGLGMILSLTLLGVSRDFEMEADQLGVQYMWRSNYDPKGFVTFFDKMASEKGYVQSASFFRTHPAFFERIVSSFSETSYLPAKDSLKVDSDEFQQIKQRLAEVLAERKQESKKKPTLKRMPQCDQEVPSASQ